MATRVAALAAAFALAVHARAQIPPQNPLEPTGFPPSFPKDERLPPPMASDQASYELKVIRSAEWVVEDNQVVGKDVEFTYRGYLVKGDEVLGDLDTNQFVLRGNVDILGQDHVVRGNQVFVDFRARRFRFVEGEVDLKKAMLQGRLESDIYVRAASVEGTDDLITATRARVTTCEYPDPHYTLDAERLSVIPNRRIIFEDFRLRILNRTILGVPRIVIPLDKRTSGITPEVGNSLDEGYFIKTQVGLPVGGDDAIARVDVMTKKGLGLGADYEFLRGNQRGEFRVYSNIFNPDGPPGVTASGTYRNDFRWGRIEGYQDYRRFSFLTGEDNVATQTRLSFTPNQAGSAQSNIFFTHNSTRSLSFTSDNSTAGAHDVREWSGRFRTNLQLNLARSIARDAGKVLSEREVLDARLQSSYDLSRVVAELDYQRNIPIGSTVNFFGGIDKTPEVTIRTDSQRLFNGKRHKWFPNFTALLSAGNYNDHFNAIDVSRYFFDFRMNRVGSEDSKLSLSYDAGFRQGIYSDDTAQYTPSLNLHLRAKPTPKFSANFRYNYSRPHGFSPLSSDRSGQYNLASLDVVGELAGELKVGGQVGFDFHQRVLGDVPWISPSLRFEYNPSKSLRVRGLANYMAQEGSWGNIRLDLAWKAGATYLGIAARYDALRDTLGNLNIFLDAFKWGRLKFSTILLYNGYLHRFESRHFSLIYDLHCAEAVLQVLENNVGFRPGREIVFFIRLKGLPFDSPFGVGRLGQPLDIGTGSGW
ncbi:MAG: hypothetical protein ACR2HJ_09135 [Fimbriimonadales bacterium]